MVTIQSQSSVAKAWQEFDGSGPMKLSSYDEHLVDFIRQSLPARRRQCPVHLVAMSSVIRSKFSAIYGNDGPDRATTIGHQVRRRDHLLMAQVINLIGTCIKPTPLRGTA